MINIAIGLLIGIAHQWGLVWRSQLASQAPNKVGRLVLYSVGGFALTGVLVGGVATAQALPIKAAGQMAIGLFIAHIWGWFKLSRQLHS